MNTPLPACLPACLPAAADLKQVQCYLANTSSDCGSPSGRLLDVQEGGINLIFSQQVGPGVPTFV